MVKLRPQQAARRAEDLSTEAVTESEPIPQAGTLIMPHYLGFGVGERERRVFQELPALSAQAGSLRETDFAAHIVNSKHSEAERSEMEKANMLAKLMDLRIADQGGISFENRKRIVLAFSDEDHPFNTGRPEVQAAILTMRVQNVHAHLQTCTKDVGNRRSLRQLVHVRAKVLQYLKRLDRGRYDMLLPRLALEPEGVEGELIV